MADITNVSKESLAQKEHKLSFNKDFQKRSGSKKATQNLTQE